MSEATHRELYLILHF